MESALWHSSMETDCPQLVNHLKSQMETRGGTFLFVRISRTFNYHILIFKKKWSFRAW